MAFEKISCLFKGRDGCNSSGGKGLSKKYFIDHLGARHFSSEDSRIYLKDQIASDPCLFSFLDLELKKLGIWLCGECLRTHSLNKNCTHANGSVVVAPTLDDEAIYGIPRPLAPVCASFEDGEASSSGSSSGCLSPCFDVYLLGCVFLKSCRTVKSIPPKLRLGFVRVFLYALDAVLACPSDVSTRVQLFILPCCVLGTFFSKNRSE